MERHERALTGVFQVLMLLWVYISPILNLGSLVFSASDLDVPLVLVVPGGTVLDAQDFGPGSLEPRIQEAPGMEAGSFGGLDHMTVQQCIQEEAQDLSTGILVPVDLPTLHADDLQNMDTDALPALDMDAIGIICSSLELVDLHQMAGVSKGFHMMAHRIIGSSFCIKHGGKLFWDYSRILQAFATAVSAARETGGQAGARIVPVGFSQLQCVRYILEDEFGYCIKHALGGQAVFGWREVFTRMLCNERQISIMPQILDQWVEDYEYLGFIRMLSDHGRLDLLCKLTFPRINTACFCDLMSTMVPESVVKAAARSLQQNEPTSGLSRLLSMAGFGDEPVFLPNDCQIPLFLLPYLYERKALIPKGCTFFCQREPDSVRFWMYVLGKDVAEGRKLVELVLEHEGEQSIRLANVFRRSVSTADLLDDEMDAYCAMLIRFHSSQLCNVHVERNYAAMLASSPKFVYHCACALFDCSQHALLDQHNPGYQADFAAEALIGRMVRFGDANVARLVEEVVKCYSDAARLLKSWIVSGADSSAVVLVWNAMRNRGYSSIEDHCCSASLEVLAYLALGPNASREVIGQMLEMLEVVEVNFNVVSKEALVFYTVLFWEAPEETVDYFLDLVPSDHRIDGEFVWKFLLKKDYSRDFCAKLLNRLGKVDYIYCGPLRSFRADLAFVFRALDDKWGLRDGQF